MGEDAAVRERDERDTVDRWSIDVPGMVMRVRRRCDLSQRDLAAALGIDASRICRLEAASQRVDLALLVEILALADLRLAVVDRDGVEVTPVPRDVVRDHAGRRMPAHLDVRPRYERSTSTLLHVHADRREPSARYHHRPIRDRRRTQDGHRLETVPDQPTGAELGLAGRGRPAAPTGAVLASLLSACVCTDECYEGGAFECECECQCED